MDALIVLSAASRIAGELAWYHYLATLIGGYILGCVVASMRAELDKL